MKNTFHFSNKSVAAALLAASLMIGCGDVAETDEVVSPDPPAESSSNFNPLKMLGMSKTPPPPPATLTAGSKIRVRTTSTLSTKSNSAGETFVGTLDDAVMDGERVVFPAGSTVLGRVTFSDDGGRVKGVAKLGLEISQLETPNGEKVAVKVLQPVSQSATSTLLSAEHMVHTCTRSVSNERFAGSQSQFGRGSSRCARRPSAAR